MQLQHCQYGYAPQCDTWNGWYEGGLKNFHVSIHLLHTLETKSPRETFVFTRVISFKMIMHICNIQSTCVFIKRYPACKHMYVTNKHPANIGLLFVFFFFKLTPYAHHACILKACTRVRSYLYQRAILHSSGKGQFKEQQTSSIYRRKYIRSSRTLMYIYIYIYTYTRNISQYVIWTMVYITSK